jgi:hypothetical protein
MNDGISMSNNVKLQTSACPIFRSFAPDRGRRETRMHREKGKLVDSVFALVLCATFAGMAMRAVGDEARALRPDVGDIVSFAARSPNRDSMVVLDVTQADALGGRNCTLDSSVMAKSGGSLFVEAKMAAAGTFRVHWAGGATSLGHENCGQSSELLLSTNQLQKMASTVGGFGVPAARKGNPTGQAALRGG